MWFNQIGYENISDLDANYFVAGVGYAYDGKWTYGVLGKFKDEFTAYRVNKMINSELKCCSRVIKRSPTTVDDINTLAVSMLLERVNIEQKNN